MVGSQRELRARQWAVQGTVANSIYSAWLHSTVFEIKRERTKKKIVLVEQFAHLQRRGECVAEIVMQDG